MSSRNNDKHTDQSSASRNILTRLRDGGFIGDNTVGKATLGYFAFPDYSFQMPQGAAFSVAKIARDLEHEKLIANVITNWPSNGWVITPKGIASLNTPEAG